MTEQVKIHKIDAKDQILGRLATNVANLLRGKGKVEFVFNQNIGDKVFIFNADKIKLTGAKIEQKKYARHSGYLGNLRFETVKTMIVSKPDEIVRRAVNGMLPKNKLRKEWMKNLTIIRGIENK